MQCLTGNELLGASIEVITEQRMPQAGEVYPDLMGAPGLQCELEQ